MNKVYLSGHLARDPEFRTTQSGKEVANFTLGVQRYRRNPENPEAPSICDFIPCVAWENKAGIARHLLKGVKVGVFGSMQTRTYNAQDGSKRYVTEVVVDEYDFMTPLAEKTRRESEPEPDYDPMPAW